MSDNIDGVVQITYSESIKLKKEARKNIIIFVKALNDDPKTKSLLSVDAKDNLRHLIKSWQNDKDANIEYYFDMKENHSWISGEIHKTKLNQLWKNYIESCHKFRISLMHLNHLCKMKMNEDENENENEIKFKKTIDILYDGIKKSNYEFNISVWHDYYGMNINKDDENKLTIMYKSLILHRGVKKNMIENCFKTNRLDDLLNLFFGNRKTFTIGETYMVDDNYDIELLPLPDLDKCPSCDSIGYQSEDNMTQPPDCLKCFNIICKKCSKYNSSSYSYVCHRCLKK